ncbi:MAG: hypothetical protein QM755_05225 [Luteolibacter sp.]
MSAIDLERLTAYHEAGHAVIALSQGRMIQEVSIVPRLQRLGHCEVKKGTAKKLKDALETDLMILLAGLAAEARLTGRYHLSGAAQDLEMARRLAEMRAPNPRQGERLLERTLSKVEHLLADAATWNAVLAVAEELCKSRKISGRAARHFYELAMAKG